MNRRKMLALCALLYTSGCGMSPVTDDAEPAEVVEAFCETLSFEPRTLHRLNTLEYDNTIQQLLGLDVSVTDDFPEDGQAYGFDNIASALTMSTLLVEKYDGAAEELLELALAKPDAVYDHYLQIEFEDVGVDGALLGDLDGSGSSWWAFWDDRAISFKFDVPETGLWDLEIRAALSYVNTLEGSYPLVQIVLDNETLTASEYTEGPVDVSRTILQLELDAGHHEIGVWLPDGNPADDPDLGWSLDADGALAFSGYTGFPIMAGDYVSLTGPTDVPAPLDPPERAALLFCDVFDDPKLSCARDILDTFGSKAWRRPMTDDELDRLIDLVDTSSAAEDAPDVAIQAAMHAILLSPHFLFRVEADPNPGSGEAFLLNDWELATRLAYFLWSDMPDDELRELADHGTLNDDETLREQIQRMLADDRRQSFIESYVGQWLHVRDVDRIERDAELYPQFDDSLRTSMINETEAVFTAFIDEALDLRGLLDAEFTYVDGPLAQLYEKGPYNATDMTEINLSGGERIGILGHASVLAVNAHSTRSSPVRRGKWVLDEILCEPPPPPPPFVPELDETQAEAQGVRDALEAHSSDPACMGCHSSMDPIGFSMEHFDAIGAWRDSYPEGEIDPSGELPDRGSFDGMAELAAILKGDPATSSCMTENLAIYATGHGRRGCAFDQIVDDALAEGFSIPAIAEAIVLSDYFRYGQGEADVGGGDQ